MSCQNCYTSSEPTAPVMWHSDHRQGCFYRHCVPNAISTYVPLCLQLHLISTLNVCVEAQAGDSNCHGSVQIKKNVETGSKVLQAPVNASHLHITIVMIDGLC